MLIVKDLREFQPTTVDRVPVGVGFVASSGDLYVRVDSGSILRDSQAAAACPILAMRLQDCCLNAFTSSAKIQGVFKIEAIIK